MLVLLLLLLLLLLQMRWPHCLPIRFAVTKKTGKNHRKFATIKPKKKKDTGVLIYTFIIFITVKPANILDRYCVINFLTILMENNHNFRLKNWRYLYQVHNIWTLEEKSVKLVSEVSRFYDKLMILIWLISRDICVLLILADIVKIWRFQTRMITSMKQ